MGRHDGRDGESIMAERGSIRVGNQTSYQAVPLDFPFDYAIARRFDAFEWFPDRRPSGEGWRAADLVPARRAEIRRKAADHGIRLSVHAALPADPLHEATASDLDDGLRLGEDLGATLLNIHMSRSGPPARYAGAVAPLARRCAGAGLRLAVENTPADGPDAFNELFECLSGEGVASGPGGAVGMCLDIGHANLHDSTRNDFLGYLDRLGPHVTIIHLHAHENRGDRDSHMPMFSGPSGEDPAGVVGLVARLKRRAFLGSVILEQWPSPRDLLDRARDGLLRLFAAP